MHVQKLLKLLEKPASILPKERSLLQELVKEHPYFYLGHALLAKAACLQGQSVEGEAVQRAAAYAPDGPYFYRWLSGACSPLPAVGKQQAKSPQEDPCANAYLERIAKRSVKTSTNAKSMEQFARIHTLLEGTLQFDPLMADNVSVKEEVTTDLSELHAASSDRFATETLANLLVQQKKYERAIEVYSHLMRKFPEKKSYFATIVEKLTHQL